MKKYENPQFYVLTLNTTDIMSISDQITPDGEYELPIVRPN